MLINQDLCVQCEACLPYCPVGAIGSQDGLISIDADKCVECNACLRAKVCPVEALTPPQLIWPRVLRNTFSDPYGKHESTQHMGRGTEEVKTNDVTGLVKPGEAGFALEVGRPGISGSFRDIEKLTMALASLPYVSFAPKSPITSFIVDRSTGRLRPDILNERVLSAIIEFIVPQQRIPEVVATLKNAAASLDTVFSVAVFCAVGPHGELPDRSDLAALGLEVSAAGKTNLGLGRPLAGRENK
ncbi:MAG TPA: 4Fe-4S binding protein [Firmicutes bacterium]|nr:4Fe-4S binding protein [Bacillota bacterium]